MPPALCALAPTATAMTSKKTIFFMICKYEFINKDKKNLGVLCNEGGIARYRTAAMSQILNELRVIGAITWD
jgi:hypothetical protein